ncbi:MAG TPA: ABC transporter permease, partial [Clostridiales bacterium]|nr:ABC transporter permease [Clostridiales bacterium]
MVSKRHVIKNIKNKDHLIVIIKRFKKHKLAVISVYVLFVLILIAIFAPIISPYNPNEIIGEFGSSPNLKHLLGTDRIGRDVLSRVIYGARISFLVGFSSIVIGLAIGIVLGLISGYYGGWVDMIIMRLTDIVMSFPYIMLILVFASILGPGLLNMILILGFLNWPAVARLVRGNVLAIKELGYIQASVVQGYSNTRILFTEVLPNTIAPILIYATSGVAWSILDEAALSFLGFGVQPPTASWGNMLEGAQSITVLTSKYWIWLPPGIMIIITVLSINFIGDALRD